MAEWSKAAVLKTVDRKVRGFESYSLRHLSGLSGRSRRFTPGPKTLVCRAIRVEPGVNSNYYIYNHGEMTERPKVLAC